MRAAAAVVGPAEVHVVDVDAGSPSTPVTDAIMPGTSSLRTTSMWSAGGTSTEWSSTITMRGSDRRPTSVPPMAWSPPRIVTRLT